MNILSKIRIEKGNLANISSFSNLDCINYKILNLWIFGYNIISQINELKVFQSSDKYKDRSRVLDKQYTAYKNKILRIVNYNDFDKFNGDNEDVVNKMISLLIFKHPGSIIMNELKNSEYLDKNSTLKPVPCAINFAMGLYFYNNNKIKTLGDDVLSIICYYNVIIWNVCYDMIIDDKGFRHEFLISDNYKYQFYDNDTISDTMYFVVFNPTITIYDSAPTYNIFNMFNSISADINNISYMFDINISDLFELRIYSNLKDCFLVRDVSCNYYKFIKNIGSITDVFLEALFFKILYNISRFPTENILNSLLLIYSIALFNGNKLKGDLNGIICNNHLEHLIMKDSKYYIMTLHLIYQNFSVHQIIIYIFILVMLIKITAKIALWHLMML